MKYYNHRYHGCPICKPSNRDVKENGWRSLNEKYQKTKETSQYIRDLGYTLVQIWECEWSAYKATNTTHNKYSYPTEHLYRMSERQILEAVLDGRIFGAVLCDLKVPEHLKDYFSEFPPIFKKATVSRDDIGQFMQAFLDRTGKKFKPTNYLIGSMFATNVLIITPLVRWYVDHDVEITKIHQIIEFMPKRSFKDFADRVSDDRRAGDRNPDLKVVAETSKLIGESTRLG